MPITKTLEMTCGSALAVNFTLKTAPPFKVSHEQCSLLPGKSALIEVSFDPGYKSDRKSGE
jgi:hydrocephalus-inducing protein